MNKRKRIITLAVAAAVLLGGLGFTLALTVGSEPTQLESAWTACEQPGRLLDDGYTLTLDPNTSELADVICVLGRLHAPSPVAKGLGASAVYGTDGEYQWGSLTASWTYWDGHTVVFTEST